MKEMGVHTHVGPTERHQQLTDFLHDIQQREEGRQELNKWQINLDQGLVQLTGRTIESESIIYKDVRHNRRIQLVDDSRRICFSEQFATIHWKQIGRVMVVHLSICQQNISTNGF